jgi:hypothetical protein
VKRKTEKYKKEKKPQKHTYTCPRGVNKQKKEPWKHRYTCLRGAKKEE